MSKIHPLFYYVFFLVVFLLVISVAFSRYKGPDERLVGIWKEVSWEYEKSDHTQPLNNKEITFEDKAALSKDLIIHESEIWEFQSGGRLRLIKKDLEEEELSWRLKGRGNILKLLHKMNSSEHYQIHELTPKTMEIHFYSELQIRGIVKMKFEKI